MLCLINTATIFCLPVLLGGCLTKDSHSMETKTAREPTPGSDMRAPNDSKCRGRPIELTERTQLNGEVFVRQECVRLDDGRVIPHGKTTESWRDGSKRLEFEYVCGTRHGKKREWHRNGNLSQEGGYSHGKEHGTWTEWHPDGTLARRWTVGHGIRNGADTEWRPNGKKRREVVWVNGRKHGPEIHWDEFGREQYRIVYVNGVGQTPSGKK